MARSVEQWRKYRSWFAFFFVIFFAVFLILSTSRFVPSVKPRSLEVRPEITRPIHPGGRPGLPLPTRPPQPPAGETGVIHLWNILLQTLSGLGSAGGLAGFFYTWSQGRRQRQKDELDLEVKRLELEKLRIDLERQKQEASRPPTKPTSTPELDV
jgi:hypothetical protein